MSTIRVGDGVVGVLLVGDRWVCVVVGIGCCHCQFVCISSICVSVLVDVRRFVISIFDVYSVFSVSVVGVGLLQVAPICVSGSGRKDNDKNNQDLSR